MTESDLKASVQAYLEAFDQRDLERCVEFFADDATLSWMGGTYQGPETIRQWHADRFAANLHVRVDEVRAQENTATIDVVATSDRMKAWRMSSMGGRITVVYDGDKISSVKFGLRFTNPLQR